MLVDTLGRRFYYLRLSVTDICNFRCKYCLPNGYAAGDKKTFLSPIECERLATAFARLGTQKVRLTGGEPSLRADLADIIHRVSAVEGINTVALTTNGYRLAKRITEWKHAGLTNLNVSIDSFDRQTFYDVTGHDRLTEILAGVDLAVSLGLTVKINAVLMRGVNDCLDDALAWVRQHPLTLRFIEVMETSDQQVFFRQHHLSGGVLQQQLLQQGWQPVLPEKTAGPAREFWHPDFSGRIGLIMPYSKDFCASCNRLRVSSLGKLHLCLFAEEGIDIRPYLDPAEPLESLMNVIHGHLADKTASHSLQQHRSGALANLSQLGG